MNRRIIEPADGGRVITRKRSAWIVVAVIAVLSLVATACGSDGDEAAGGGTVIAIENVTLIDMTSADPVAGMTVLVTGNRISEVGPSGDVAIPDGAEVVDGSGRYLMPGLWDMHTHPSRDRQIEYLPLLAANGVTGTRDMAGDFDTILRFREEIEEGTLVSPRIFAAGRRIDGPIFLDDKGIIVSNEEEARAAVRAQQDLGVDFIKVFDEVPPAAFFALAEEANEIGIDFAGHVPFGISAAEASDAGLKSFEHLLSVLPGCSTLEEEILTSIEDAVNNEGELAYLNAFFKGQFDAINSLDPAKCDALMEKFAENETYQSATLVVFEILSLADADNLPQDDHLKYVTEEQQALWGAEVMGYLGIIPSEFLPERAALFQSQLDLIKQMEESGVPLIAGTDTASTFGVPGFSLHRELELYAQAGLTPYEVLRTATVNPARYFGMEDELGTIEEGKLADLVLLDANPMDNISNTQAINTVIADGRMYDRSSLDAVLAEVEANALAGGIEGTSDRNVDGLEDE